ncbi:hypothetical protein [Bizionia sp.]|uniref:hypothetical protein n=1 Tax=Bizionia sp. TaxID=1954480 RepID=UPI003A907952
MKKILILTITLLTQISYSQVKTKLFYKDGKTAIEKCKIKGNTLKCEIGNKKIKFTSSNINAVEQNSKRYVYMKIENSNKPKLMRQLIKGKTSLFEITKMTAPQTQGTTTAYYVKRKSWTNVKKIGTMRYNKDKVIAYFSDCPLLIEKVKSKSFKDKSPFKLISYFNENCGN